MRLGKMGVLALASTAIVMTMPVAIAQQADGARNYDVPSQDLGAALRQVAQQSGTPVIVPTDLVDGLTSPALKGRYLPAEAVGQLLRGSHLRVVTVGATLVVQRDDPAPEGNQNAEGDREILVTGTRIRGSGPVGVPVITIDRKDMAEAGFSTTQQIVQSIPQNYSGGAIEGMSGLITGAGNGNVSRGVGVNLRGLGQGSTLVLINGDRPPLGGFSGTFSDLSVIPASAIERIEIVPDGSSAIYGSDAVAGVVNVVTRNNFSGAETSFRIGTADGDAQEYQFSQVLGAKWSTGNVVVAYEFYHRDNLSADDRPYITDDLRPFGGGDYRGNYASPGTIVAGGINFAIPRGQFGNGLTAAQLTRGVINRGDGWDGTDILPEQQRHSLFVSFSQDLTSNLRLYARGLGTWRKFDVAVRSGADTRRTVPVTNPYYVDPIGTHLPIGVNYSFVRDLGNERYRGDVLAYGGTAGLELTLGGWSVDSHGTWGKQDERYDYLNRVNSARLALALADTNPATAYNLLGDGPSTNPATIESIRGYNKRRWDALVWSASLRADGPLFALPAGDVRLAVGAEYREDRYRDRENISYTSTLAPRANALTPLPGPRTVKGAYAELRIPVFNEAMAVPLFRRLDLSAAVRSEHYSDFGSTTNPKVSFAWEPLGGITLRGSYGKSFRAPGVTELRQDPDTFGQFAYPVVDPQSPTGMSNIMVIRGNDPDLGPERATTWTLGADLKPAALPGLRLGVTWFDVNYRDRIASVASSVTTYLINRDIYAPILTFNPSAARIAELFASPYYLDLAGIPSSAPIVAIADARTRNLSIVKQSGLDLDMQYDFGLGGGNATIGATGTYIFGIKQQLTATSAPVDVVDSVGNPIDLRLRGRASWNKGGFGVALFATYADGYQNRTVTPAQRVSSWTTIDLNLSYSFQQTSGPFKGLRVALNASNLFDSDPPYVSYVVGTLAVGFDGENANPMGRFVALQVSKSW
ncbi:TonB-dependent receptor [Sphingomonas sp. R-74633]|uniref:TonB-dependent receptor n=1 Tax=Sphingomonas sp. R-74633 TaxID=2751188 RepID=UPI0015D12BA8|nr:TonB-dependent receptor [Sphingomonas sp. R-74633]NYT41047.1 TonB-dependent receptor [Sphingomonas sp. R-74633]